MSYAALSDVQALIAKFTINTLSKPTDTQAGVIITGISAEIDSVIAGLGYNVPVISPPPQFLAWLTLLNAYGAAAAIIRSIFADKSGSADGYEGGIEAYYGSQYKQGIARLISGDAIPPDLATNAATIYPSTYFTRNPDVEEDVGLLGVPFFEKAKVF
jgi:hypothetical protein